MNSGVGNCCNIDDLLGLNNVNMKLKLFIYEFIDEVKSNINNLVCTDCIGEYDKKLLKYSTFLELIEIYESKYNLNIVIDRNYNSLSIFTTEGKLVGQILQSNYCDENFFSQNHLYNVVENDFRGLGFGKIMYKLYVELSKIDPSFYLPNIEYTNIVSMINFYLNNGFKVTGKIISGNFENVTSNDYIIYKTIKNQYLSGLKEVKLPYTIVLKKI